MNIRDSVHGPINFSDEEQLVIDHPLFQRLRGIKQLGFLHWVFPGATHTRFEHSLGILFVCKKIVLAIQQNQNFIEKYSQIFIKNTGKNISPILEKALKALETPRVVSNLYLACLLHDIGHGPFSHNTEFLTHSLSWDFIMKNWNVHQDPWLEKSFIKLKDASIPPRHEIFSCLIIRELFHDVFPDDPQRLQDVLSIINLSIDPFPKGSLDSYGVRLLFSDILSGEIDADRIDYLLRDSAATGVKYGVFDFERLLENLCCFVDEKNQVRIALKSNGLLAFEHFLFSRYQMYLQVYMHRTNQAMENALKFLLKKMGQNSVEVEIFFPKNRDEFLHFTDQNFSSILLRTISQFALLPKKLELTTLCNKFFSERKTWKTIYERISTFEDPKYATILQKLKNIPDLEPYVVGSIYAKNLFESNPESQKIPIFLYEEPLSDQIVWSKQELSCLYQKMRDKVFLHRIIVHPDCWGRALETLSL